MSGLYHEKALAEHAKNDTLVFGAVMTIDQLKKLRQDNRVSLLDVAARTGLPEEYLEKLEEKTIPAMEGDLERIRKAILQTVKEQSEPDDET